MPRAIIVVFAFVLAACAEPDAPPPPPAALPLEAVANVPDWAADAVFYQIFPERFANGDRSNDPTRTTLEYEADVPASWRISPWTGDWYAQADWEAGRGDFYHSVTRRRYGGDLQGVIDRLDYLRELGVNTLYFNPVFWARSMHKYDGNSFHHIDPFFGPDPEGDLALIAAEDPSDPEGWAWTSADRLFVTLLDEAHQRGLRVVIDGVFNHTGRDFFAFADLRERQQDSPYRDWFHVVAFDDPATETDEFDWEGWWGYKPLPVFADNADGTDLHPGPKQYIFDATRRWMDPNGDGEPSDGIDGWRLDVAAEVPDAFWRDWNRLVFGLNPDAYTVSEQWEDAADYLAQTGFSATMNYYAFAQPVKGFLIDAQIPVSDFVHVLDARRTAFSPAQQRAMQNLVDSHDTPRLATMIMNGDRPYAEPPIYDYDRQAGPRDVPDYNVQAPTPQARQVQRLVALFQMTYVGAPMIYYGTEAGMWGADDPDDRKPMPWPEMRFARETADPLGRPRTPDAAGFNAEVHAFYRDVIALRRSHQALRQGDFAWLAHDDVAQTLAFSRTWEDQHLLVAINRSVMRQTLRLPLTTDTPAQGMKPVFVTTGSTEDLDLRFENSHFTLTLPPRTGTVLHRTGTE